MKSDIEVLKSMLDRAGVKWKQGDAHDAQYSVQLVPPGARSIRTLQDDDYDPDVGRVEIQPIPGGYDGFYSEFVFDAAGSLIAVWGWE